MRKNYRCARLLLSSQASVKSVVWRTKTLLAIDNRAKHWYTIFVSEFGCGVVVGVCVLSHGRDGANARQGLLRRDDNKLLVAYRLRGKRLRRVVPIVLRRRRRVLRRTAQNGFFSHENAWLRRRLLRLPLLQKEVVELCRRT